MSPVPQRSSETVISLFSSYCPECEGIWEPLCTHQTGSTRVRQQEERTALLNALADREEEFYEL